MKTPIWTKADAKRAEKMGWRVSSWRDATTGQRTTSIGRAGDRFKSNDEAIEWAISMVESNAIMAVDDDDIRGIKTCRKALFLCANG